MRHASSGANCVDGEIRESAEITGAAVVLGAATVVGAGMVVKPDEPAAEQPATTVKSETAPSAVDRSRIVQVLHLAALGRANGRV